MDIISCYVDGSFSSLDKKTKWAYILIENNKNIKQDCGVLTSPVILEGYQVGGEVMSVIQALYFAEENNIKLDIYYDFVGIKNWVADIVGEKPWKTNKEYTKYYRNFVLKRKNYINNFIKVKGHSGDYWNEEVDKLVKTATNLTEINF